MVRSSFTVVELAINVVEDPQEATPGSQRR